MAGIQLPGERTFPIRASRARLTSASTNRHRPARRSVGPVTPRHRRTDRNCSTGDPLRQLVTLDEFHDEGVDITRLFEAVNDRDVGVVQRG